MRNAASVLIVLLVLLGGYSFLRYHDAAKVYATYVHPESQSTRAETRKVFVSAYPTICVAEASGFEGSGTIQAYVARGKVLHESYGEQRGRQVFFYVLVDHTTNTLYFWQKGTTQGYVSTPEGFDGVVGGNSESSSLTLLRRGSCSPWWFPDYSKLDVPDGVNFVPLDQM